MDRGGKERSDATTEPREGSASRIETMTEADLGAVLAIQDASPETSKWDEASLQGELARTWAHLWVVRRNSSVVAFLATWLVADELHVLNIATHPLHRREGHARALLHHALAFARTKEVRLVLLEVRRSNAAAIGLYRAIGFSAMGLRERYYSNDEDAVEMVLRLDPASGAVIPSPDEVRL
jgi:[ribosomal protein S18]-alanine N-acetyltransferase